MSYAEVVQAIADATQDAQTLEDVINGAPDTQVTARLGRKIWTLATINSKIEYVRTQADSAAQQINTARNNVQSLLDSKVNELDNAINAAAAAGAGANGWTTDLVVENGLTQKQINSRADYVNALNYLTKAEIDDLNTATPTLDHTKSLQKAIDASVLQGKKCFIPRMTGAYNIKVEPDAWTALPNDKVASGWLAYDYRAGLILNSGCHLVFGANTQLKAIATDCWAGIGLCVVGDNVTIDGNGALFLGERLTHNYTSVKVPSSKTSAEWVWGIVVVGKNVTINNMQLKDWTGDCINVWSNHRIRTDNPTAPHPSSSPHYVYDLKILNCVVDGARRNNISVTDCDGFLIDNCLVMRAGYTDANGTLGTNPKLGIDLEPYKSGNPADGFDTSEVVQNGTVSNCRFVENRIGDCTAYNTYNIKIVNNHSTAGLSYGYSQNTVIANNVIDMSIIRQNNPGTAAGTGVGSLGGANSDRFNHVNNSVVANNVFYGCSVGVAVYGKDALVNNNLFVKCTLGINIYKGTDLQISGNMFYQCLSTAINGGLIGKSGEIGKLSITNNSVMYKNDTSNTDNNNSHAISLNASGQTVIYFANNTINKSTKGVKISGDYSLNMVDNLFDSVQTDVYLSAGAVLALEATTGDLVVQGNTFINSLNFYMPISFAAKAVVKNNSFLNCSANGLISIGGANSKIIDNIFEFGGSANGGTGVYTSSTANNVAFMGNRFFSASGYKFDTDIVTYNSTNNTIANNFITSRIQNGTTDVVHGNVVVGKVYKATATYDPPSLATATQQSTTVTLTGATVGETVAVSFDKPLQGTRMWAEVTSTDTVTVYHRNDTGATVDLPSGTLTVKIV